MEPTSETKQAEKTETARYDLTPNEQAFYRMVNQKAINAKLTIYALNVDSERLEAEQKKLNARIAEAQRERDLAETQFGGALAFLGLTRGMEPPIVLAEDFTHITPGGK
jgi:hypothetical protein